MLTQIFSSHDRHADSDMNTNLSRDGSPLRSYSRTARYNRRRTCRADTGIRTRSPCNLSDTRIYRSPDYTYCCYLKSNHTNVQSYGYVNVYTHNVRCRRRRRSCSRKRSEPDTRGRTVLQHTASRTLLLFAICPRALHVCCLPLTTLPYLSLDVSTDDRRSTEKLSH